MQQIEIRAISREKALVEIVPPIEEVQNKIIDFSFGSVKPKYIAIGPQFPKSELVINTNAANYNRRTIYDKVGRTISNLLY